MLRKLLANQPIASTAPVHKEGELYKVVDIHGIEFSLYYGYYEDRDRENPLVEPMPIYPNLQLNPQYTDDGRMIVTRMQDACEHYVGKAVEDRECRGCRCFEKSAEFFGLCTCPKNKNPID